MLSNEQPKPINMSNVNVISAKQSYGMEKQEDRCARALSYESRDQVNLNDGGQIFSQKNHKDSHKDSNHYYGM